MGTNDTIEELRAYLDDRADADQPAGAAAPIPNEEMRLLMGVDRLEQERDALRAENERLREALEHYAAMDPAGHLWDGGRKAQRTLYSGKPANEPEWFTHDSHQPPFDLAPAQLVELQAPTTGGVFAIRRVDELPWHPGLRYRPALSASGLPLCSAEGLELGVKYVWVTDAGNVTQARKDGTGMEFPHNPETHRRPGPASESLMEVYRE